jgi:S-adenosylmethionine-diacylglycerol 3-amino-3-carboxypropyl transferase
MSVETEQQAARADRRASGTGETRAALGGRISYAQVWEDPAVLSAALDVGPEDDVLSVCSAGDNAFSLALAGARRVVCVDLSAPQLSVAELKLAAAVHFDLDRFRSLLGLGGMGQRVSLYHDLRPHLSERAQNWWDANEADIRTGIVGCGRFERYLRLFRERMLPMVHSRRTVDALLALDDLDRQQAFFADRWNTLRWRGLFRVFFSRFVMARSGRSPAQFAHVEGPVGEVFLKRAEHVLTRLPIASNYFVQWILGGRFPDLEQAHPYLSADGHAALGAAADRITFVHDDLISHLSGVEAGAYAAFNLSNVPEYLGEAEHHALLEAVVGGASSGARVAYWNLLVPRSRPERLASVLHTDPVRGADLLFQDRAFVYGGFQIETVA